MYDFYSGAPLVNAPSPLIYKRKECPVFQQSVTTTDVMQKSCGFLKIYNPIILSFRILIHAVVMLHRMK
jgi:hypothetical protein